MKPSTGRLCLPLTSQTVGLHEDSSLTACGGGSIDSVSPPTSSRRPLPFYFSSHSPASCWAPHLSRINQSFDVIESRQEGFPFKLLLQHADEWSDSCFFFTFLWSSKNENEEKNIIYAQRYISKGRLEDFLHLTIWKALNSKISDEKPNLKIQKYFKPTKDHRNHLLIFWFIYDRILKNILFLSVCVVNVLLWVRD